MTEFELIRTYFASRSLARDDVSVGIGDDTSRGPLSVVITAIGHVPAGKSLRRSGARAGDGVYISGELGDAALALAHRTGTHQLGNADAVRLRARLERPTPRVALGVA